jgi:hypothetical protein
MVQDFCRFLNDDIGFGTSGPGWVLEYADDGTANSSQPISGGLVKFDELPPANLWVGANTPTVGSWVQLRSLPGLTTEIFQVIIKVATGALRFNLIPLGDKAIPTNGTTTSAVDPVLPATALGYFDGSATAGMSSSWLSVAADESTATWHIDSQAGGTNGSWGYLGETEDGPGDRNFVLGHLAINTVFVSSFATLQPFRTLSLRDNVTVLGAQSRWVRFGPATVAIGTRAPLDALGLVPLFRVGVACWQTGSAPQGQIYFAGWLRHVRDTQFNLASRGTIGASWMSVSHSATQAGVAIPWDGQPYP